MIPEIVLNSPLIGLAATLLSYKLGERLTEKLGVSFLPPILTACALLMALISFTPFFSYEQYQLGGSFIHFLLGPATIALALPLVNNFATLCRHWKILLAGAFVGSVAGIASVILCARFFGASPQVVMSLIPKSVTTPIAMDISAGLGGIPPLTAACVIFTGIFGAMAGHKVLVLCRVKKDIAIGLAIGASSHALGVSTCIGKSSLQAAIGSLAIALVGIGTALLSGSVLSLLDNFR